jgi:hypothetical protein
MKLARNSLVIRSLLAVFLCGLPAVAADLPPIMNSLTNQTLFLQPGFEHHTSRLDCTHWVHALYERAGLHYPYATSRTLFQGVKEFQRVLSPQPGDLIVWQGHAGIVLDPLRGRFLSALRRGIRMSSYLSSYWAQRGSPRFFRYVRSVGK